MLKYVLKKNSFVSDLSVESCFQDKRKFHSPLCRFFQLKRVSHLVVSHAITANQIVREPIIGLIKWLRPKGLKVYSYVEKCAEFKY